MLTALPIPGSFYRFASPVSCVLCPVVWQTFQCVITFFQYVLRSDVGSFLYVVTNGDASGVGQYIRSVMTDNASRPREVTLGLI